jgi:hypothetical protein
MDLLYLFTSYLFFISTLINLLNWLYRLQTDGFHIAFFSNWIKKTDNKKRTLYILILSIFGLIGYIPVILFENLLTAYHLLITCIFLINIIIFLQDIIEYRFRLPTISVRVFTISIVTLISVWLLYFIPLTDSFFWMLIIDRILVFIILFLILIFSFPNEIYTDIKIERVRKLKASFPDLKIMLFIGGNTAEISFNLTAQLLATKIQITKSPKTLLGINDIAQFMLKNINNNVQVCLIGVNNINNKEMRAIGELLHPQLIVTDNKIEKLSLSDLTDIIAEEGILICNINNINVNQQAIRELNYLKTKKIELVLYQTESNLQNYNHILRNYSLIISANNVVSMRKSTTYNLNWDDKIYKIRTRLIGDENIQGLLASIIVAKNSGLNLKEILAIIPLLRSVKGHLTVRILTNRSTLVDNSCGLSVSSLYSSIAYMRIFSGKKTLILSSIFDLEDMALKNISYPLEEIAATCNLLLVLDTTTYKIAKRVISQLDSNCRVQFKKIYKINNFLQKETAGRHNVTVLTGKRTNMFWGGRLKYY